MRDVWNEIKNGLKKKNVPFEIIFEITRRCNLNCCHCYNLKDNRQLELNAVKGVLEQLRRAGCLFVVFTGGEVFLRDDFLEILGFASRLGFSIKIFTNGTLVDWKTAGMLKSFSINEVGVSILGARAGTHDGLTGVKGSFEKSVSAVKMLKQEGIPVHIKCSLMRGNFSEYKDVIALAGSIGVTYIVDPVISPKDDGSREVLKHRLDTGELECFYHEQFSQINDVRSEDFFTCDAGRTFGSISAAGDVYPCIQLPLKIGNVLEREFRDIWADSAVLHKMRTADVRDYSVCSQCEISGYCSRCPGLAYIEDGDLFGPSQMACFSARLYKDYVENS